MKLLAIDGNSIINRAFYGIKQLTTKDGRYTNAVYGFINILNKLIDMEEPDGIAVAFDLKSPTFRHKKFNEYKAGRKGMPDELASQLSILKEWLTLSGFVCLEKEGYEADDILGTLSVIANSDTDSCVIATGDRDSLQLVSDYTRVLLTTTKMGKPEIINYDKNSLFEKYGLTPDEMIELKSLMGDSSDNIPGVAGIGEKTATDLISRFHNIKYIYDNIDEIDIKQTVKNKLLVGKESAELSHELGTIYKSVPIDKNINNYLKKEPQVKELVKLMTDLEFFKLIDKMGLKAKINSDVNLRIDTKNVKEFSVIENNSFSNLECLDIYISHDIVIVCNNNVYKCDDNYLEKIISNEKIEKRVYDFKNIRKKYTNSKSIIFDAKLAGYLINPSASSYSIDRLVEEYCKVNPKVDSEDESIVSACRFSCAMDEMKLSLQKSGQFDLLQKIEIPLSEVLADMETSGFYINCQGLKQMSEELKDRISVIQDKIYNLVGYEFNLNSPKQLGVALFEKLELPVRKKTKSGYSTNAEVLESLKYAHPAVELLLEYRQLAKLKSTYTDGLQQCISGDGRIHSTFNQTEARTGRISSLEPNLQNIPVRTSEGKRLREYFTAGDGRVLCDADYSQIELRVLASIANDKNMINAFNSGTDIHTVTASQVFGMPLDMVTPIMRSRAKAVNFGIVYGISAFSLGKDIGVSNKEASEYIKNYNASYPSIESYMNDTIKKARQDGFVTTLYGRRRYIPELSNSNKVLQAFGERVARNAPIQGTAADIIKIAMIRVNQRLKKEIPNAKLILQVHDELIVECDKCDAEKTCKLLEQEMENSANLSVKLTAEAHYGKTWLEAKE